MAGHTARFFVHGLPSEGTTNLDPEQSRHAKALRIAIHDPVELFDGYNEYTGRLKGWDGNSATVEIMAKSEEKGIPGAQITLATAFPKGKQADFLIQKATEVGVDTIIPLNSKNSVVDPRETKLERLKKIAINACEQSGRTKIPKILSPITVDKILSETKNYDLCFIAEKNGKKIENISAKNILAIVGPEGGFTDAEISQAKEAGCIPVALGPNFLRTETAGIVLVATLVNTGA